MPTSKPPIPTKIQVKEERAYTPDREQNIKENIRHRLEKP